MNSRDNFQKRRLISSYFSVVVSISLVLFLVGVLGLLLLNSKKVSDHFKEQIALTIYINDSAKPIEIKQLQKSFQKKGIEVITNSEVVLVEKKSTKTQLISSPIFHFFVSIT